VGIDCAAARAQLLAAAARIDDRGRRAADRRGPLAAAAGRIDRAGRAAVVRRARELASYSRAPRAQLDRHAVHLHQKARELRAASRRGIDARTQWQRRVAATVLDRKLTVARAGAEREAAALRARVGDLDRAARALAARREQALKAGRSALNAHDPQRTLERGYAVVATRDGDPIAGAGELRDARAFQVLMADGAVAAHVDDNGEGRPDGRD
jgi:exodeoxyribonuclease VII large subunit